MPPIHMEHLYPPQTSTTATLEMLAGVTFNTRTNPPPIANLRIKLAMSKELIGQFLEVHELLRIVHREETQRGKITTEAEAHRIQLKLFMILPPSKPRRTQILLGESPYPERRLELHQLTPLLEPFQPLISNPHQATCDSPAYKNRSLRPHRRLEMATKVPLPRSIDRIDRATTYGLYRYLRFMEATSSPRMMWYVEPAAIHLTPKS